MEQIKDKRTLQILRRKMPKGFEQTVLKRASVAVHNVMAARDLRDLSNNPGMRLEKLPEYAGNNTYSVRINNKWRVKFTWEENRAMNIEVVDYH